MPRDINIMMILWGYLVLMNLITFTVFIVDKMKAKKHHYRIPERTLLGLSLLGGSIGGLFAMYMAHHKTRKRVFAVGIPVMLIVQIVIVYLITHL